MTDPAGELAGLVGRAAQLDYTVTAEDAAGRWGNDVPVLATPVLLWISEITAMKAVADAISLPWMTVGLAHQSSHLAPTPVG
jgi:fluoroacetyl-CoA thioesterase